MRRLVVLATCACAVIVAGCGVSEKDQVKVVAEAYLDAVADGDGERACALLTENAQRGFARAVGAPGKGRRCREFVSRQLDALITEEQRRALQDARVQGVEVTGDIATARAAGANGTIRLVKQDGRWRLAEAFVG